MSNVTIFVVGLCVVLLLSSGLLYTILEMRSMYNKSE
jgi:hypothetical protein